MADGPVQIIVEEEPFIGGLLYLRGQDFHDPVIDLFAPPIVEHLSAQRLLGPIAEVERRFLSQSNGVKLFFHPVGGNLGVQRRAEDGRRLTSHDELPIADEHGDPTKDVPHHPAPSNGDGQAFRLGVGLSGQDGTLSEDLGPGCVIAIQQLLHAG